MKGIVKTVAAHYKVTENFINVRRTRAPEETEIRAVAMRIFYFDLGWGVTKIGRRFGMDHSTVFHHCHWRTVSAEMIDALKDIRTALGITDTKDPAGCISTQGDELAKKYPPNYMGRFVIGEKAERKTKQQKEWARDNLEYIRGVGWQKKAKA